MTTAEYIERLRQHIRPTEEEATEAGEAQWWRELPAKEALLLMYQWDDVPFLISLVELHRLFAEVIPGGVYTHEMGMAERVRRWLETGKRDVDPRASFDQAIGNKPVTIVVDGLKGVS